MTILSNTKSTLILGIGDTLLSDEGIGVHVVQHLKKQDLPDHIEVLDGGTAGADLLDVICGLEKLIIIDAIDSDFEPGTIIELTDSDLLHIGSANLSLHNIDLPQTLAMAHLLDQAPKATSIIGIQPQSIAPGTELTAPLQKAIEPAAQKALAHT